LTRATIYAYIDVVKKEDKRCPSANKLATKALLFHSGMQTMLPETVKRITTENV